MRRQVTFVLTDQEKTVLRIAAAAAALEKTAHRVKHRAIVDALELGLPVRMVGLYADYSGGQVSRIGTGKQVLR